MPEPTLGSFREFHHVSQLLTLYLQKRWEKETFGFNYEPSPTFLSVYCEDNWEGFCLLLAPLPSDEVSRTRTNIPLLGGGILDRYPDYDQWTFNLGFSSTACITRFITPQLLQDKTTIKGTGFLNLRVSGWNSAPPTAPFILTVGIWLVCLGKVKADGSYTNVYTKGGPATGAIGSFTTTSTVEDKRSFQIELPNLDFTLDPSERLVLSVALTVATANVTGYARLLFKRGEAESFVHLPVIEG
jgi:hypothetical protein